jgi:hypothetical protein
MVKAKLSQFGRRCSKCGSTSLRVLCVGRVSLYYDTESGDLLDDVNVLDDETLRVEAVQCMDCGGNSAPLENHFFGTTLYLVPPPNVQRQKVN